MKKAIFDPYVAFQLWRQTKGVVNSVRPSEVVDNADIVGDST